MTFAFGGDGNMRGKWKNGHKYGKAVQTFETGDIYDGFWRDNSRGSGRVRPTSSHSFSQRRRNSVTFVLSKYNAPASPGRGIRKWYTVIVVGGLGGCGTIGSDDRNIL